jgi:hypothetical protein
MSRPDTEAFQRPARAIYVSWGIPRLSTNDKKYRLVAPLSMVYNFIEIR